jgi:hypothetical protein
VGHPLKLHACVAASGPHRAPPLAAGVIVARVREAVPVAMPWPFTQLLLPSHAHSDHGVWTQSTGHWLYVHACSQARPGMMR